MPSAIILLLVGVVSFAGAQQGYAAPSWTRLPLKSTGGPPFESSHTIDAPEITYTRMVTADITQGHTVTVNVTQSRTVTAMSAIVIIPTAVESSSPASAVSNSPATVASSSPTTVASSISTTVASSSPTTTPSYNGKGDCSPRPPGHGPMPRVDSASSFRNYPEFSVYAASAPLPENYTKVYADKLATNTGGKYMGYQMLKTYSTRDCANTCDQQPGCRAFNIFFERTPAVNIGRNCTNPPSSTTIKCALWDWRLSPADATNSGSKLWDFEGT
jgi:hypothetical protein